ncbi:MAG TPA: hypothetical protein VJU18_03810 [Vicinamibacteria bacterium]|nr:hypothetical protein [Vicinamibacteria bacterium]
MRSRLLATGLGGMLLGSCGSPAAPGSDDFVRFLRSTSGFCAPDHDCQGGIEIEGTGVLRVDPTGVMVGGLPPANYQAQLSTGDLAETKRRLTDAAFVAALAASEACLPEIADVHETMELELESRTYRRSVASCVDPALRSVRSYLDALLARYPPR